MATITSTGIGSGLDVNTILTQLVALERKPIEQLQTEAGKLDARLSSFGRVQSSLDTLRSAARTLTDAATWQAVTGTSADSAAVQVQAGSNTSPGAYAVRVNTLAAAQINATTAVAGATTAIGEGTLHIQLGAWNDDATGFTPKTGTSTIDISIGPGEDTLEKIRDKINGTANVGVKASIVNDATGSRLVLQSTTTGKENGFRIQVDDNDGVPDDDSGLSRLAYDPENGIAVSSRPQPGANATATINGLPVESASNTLSNVIDGVTLTLAKQTASAVDVTISRDNTSMRKAVDTFVSAYNDLNKLLRDQTKYDATSKSAGTLQGDRTAIAIMAQVRQAMGLSSTASSTFGRVSDIGLQIQTDGSIKTTGSKLDSAIGNLDEIRKFFSAAGTGSGTEGLATRLRALTDQFLGTDGSVSTRQEGLRKLKTVNTDRQAVLEDRVVATEKRLRAQYQQLDLNMARLTGLSSYVTQQVTRWNNS